MGERMEFWKRTPLYICAVIRGMLFIGCTIQMILGAVWLGCNFFQVQDFGEPESALYCQIYGMLGGSPCIVYLFQLASAFAAGYCLLHKLQGKVSSRVEREGLPGKISAGKGIPGKGFPGRAYAVWGSLVLLSFPFAMQCHLAVLPDSFLGSLFLLMLFFLTDFLFPEVLFSDGDGRKKVLKKCAPKRRRSLRRLRALASAAVCGGLMIILSGVADAEGREAVPERSIQSVLASRLAWPSLFNDASYWPEELQEITREVLWESTFYPGNMEILQETVERSVGAEAAKGYFMQMAEVGWKYRRAVVLHQIGWDVLGYAVTPLIVPRQLLGEAYDSYTGRNYEIMRGNAPVLTKYYVEYACWWFGCCMALALCLAVLRAAVLGKAPEGRGILWGRLAALAGMFALLAGIQVVLLTMRGAGLMDYKRSIAVNELWYLMAVLFTEERGI